VIYFQIKHQAAFDVDEEGMRKARLWNRFLLQSTTSLQIWSSIHYLYCRPGKMKILFMEKMFNPVEKQCH